jgi:hypothetical protein
MVVLTSSSLDALACTCRPNSPRQAYENARAVFVGEFTGFSIRRRRQATKLKFKIEKQWKGELPTEAVLGYFDNPSLCGDLDFVKGQKYLIYVGVLEDELFIWVDCGRSRNLKNAAEDIEYLTSQQSSFKVIPTPPPNKALQLTGEIACFLK